MLAALLAISNGAAVHESRQLPSWLIFDVSRKMNLCSLSAVLCVFGSTAIGVFTGVDGGFRSAVCGGGVGLAIGLVSASVMVALERASMPTREGKRVLPFAIFSLAAIMAPIASCAMSAFGAQKVAAALSRHIATANQANKALEPTPGSVMPRAEPRVTPAPSVAHL